MVYLKVKGINASSKKTRILIKSAFAQLLKEKKEINGITISELVKLAGITRGTFYTHYDNIYDVAKDFQNEFLDILFNNVDQIKSIDDMQKYVFMIFKHLEVNEELYRMMLSTDEPLLFMNRLNRMMNKHLNDFLKNKDIDNKVLNISFFVDGTIHLFIKYFRNEIDISLEELYLYVIYIFKQIFKIDENIPKNLS